MRIFLSSQKEFDHLHEADLPQLDIRRATDKYKVTLGYICIWKVPVTDLNEQD